MAEKTILTCDVCALEGAFTESTERVQLTAFGTRRRAIVDVCDRHLASLFRLGTSAGRGLTKVQPNGHRDVDRELRCPLCGHESTGTGLSAHYRAKHPDLEYDREAAKAAYLEAHPKAAVA